MNYSFADDKGYDLSVFLFLFLSVSLLLPLHLHLPLPPPPSSSPSPTAIHESSLSLSLSFSLSHGYPWTLPLPHLVNSINPLFLESILESPPCVSIIFVPIYKGINTLQYTTAVYIEISIFMHIRVCIRYCVFEMNIYNTFVDVSVWWCQ